MSVNGWIRGFLMLGPDLLINTTEHPKPRIEMANHTMRFAI